MKNDYGKLLHKVSDARSFFRANLYFIPSIIIIACAIATFFIVGHIPEDQYDPMDHMLPYIFFAVAIVIPIYATIVWRLRTPLEGRLFEGGVIINRGKNTVADIAFSDIEGIIYYTMKFEGIATERIYTIVGKNGDRIKIPHKGIRSRKFNDFLDMLVHEHTAYLTQNLTPENISRTHVKFSTNLELINGKLVNTAKGNEIDIRDVTDVQVRDGHIRIIANIEGKEKVWLRTEPIQEVFNLGALVYIVAQNKH